MLSEEFNNEIGALIRALQSQVYGSPHLPVDAKREALDHLEQAIVALCALHISLRQQK